MMLQTPGEMLLFPSEFTKGQKGIPINGLIWMGSKAEMKSRISEKLNAGYHVIKLKIGALDFQEELSILRDIRKEFSPRDLEIRVDANGAFSPDEALERLKALSDFNIHSIEQPIKPGQWEYMSRLCESSPMDIALDEELISLRKSVERKKLLQEVKPQYLILKPSLIGGMGVTREWIHLAGSIGAGWWITSALESNVGLNAIAQFTYTLKTDFPQGLGTGSLFTNNIPSPLYIQGEELFYNPDGKWDWSLISDSQGILDR
jgi:L-alanine-DL-glutamate epimerase-like enolase superfamily enzyme